MQLYLSRFCDPTENKILTCLPNIQVDPIIKCGNDFREIFFWRDTLHTVPSRLHSEYVDCSSHLRFIVSVPLRLRVHWTVRKKYCIQLVGHHLKAMYVRIKTKHREVVLLLGLAVPCRQPSFFQALGQKPPVPSLQVGMR